MPGAVMQILGLGHGGDHAGASDYPHRTTLLLLAACLSVTLLATVYNHFLRPAIRFSELSKLPAAHWTCHFSGRWIARQRKGGYESRAIFAAHRRLDPDGSSTGSGDSSSISKARVLRLAPDEVSVAAPAGVRRIYAGDFERPPWFDAFMNYDGTRNLVTAHGAAHTSRRRMMSGVLSLSALRRSPDFKAIAAVVLLGRLVPLLKDAANEGKGGKEKGGVDMYRLMFALGVDFMSAYEFGVQNGYDLVSKDKTAERHAYFRLAALKLREMEGAAKAKKAGKELEEQLMTMLELTRERMQRDDDVPARDDDSADANREDEAGERLRRLRSTRTRPISFANLSEQVFEKENWPSMRDSLRVVASEMLDNIEASREGIGLSLTYATHELSLAHNSGIQRQLRDELRGCASLFAAISEQTFDTELLKDLDALPLLDAVISETFRLHPPAAGPQRRQVPPNGVTLEGYYIPAGVTVYATPYLLHRDPVAFPDADSWLPERWLDNGDAEGDEKGRQTKGAHRASLMTFCTGPRTCVGNNFAVTVIKLTLAVIYSNFESRVIDDEGIEPVDDIMNWPRGDKLILGFKEV